MFSDWRGALGQAAQRLKQVALDMSDLEVRARGSPPPAPPRAPPPPPPPPRPRPRPPPLRVVTSLEHSRLLPPPWDGRAGGWPPRCGWAGA